MPWAKAKLYTVRNYECWDFFWNKGLKSDKKVEDGTCGSDPGPINFVSFESNYKCRPGSWATEYLRVLLLSWLLQYLSS